MYKKQNVFLIKIFLIVSLFFTLASSNSIQSYQEKFNLSKIAYLNIILSNNKAKEIEYLKELIKYGNILGKSTMKYKLELNRLNKKESVHKPVFKKFTYQKKYTILSVKQTKNSITIRFNKKIDKSFIEFKEYKANRYYYDNFYLKGNFKFARETKLKFDAISKTIVTQASKNRLKISLMNKKNPKTIYIINKSNIIIKILDKPKKSKVKTTIKPSKKVIPNKFQNQNYFSPNNKVIVIDPGHGGKDAGAVGSKRKYEKKIVLNVGKYLRDELKKDGYKVFLTRNRDKYIRLSNRTKFANKKNATLFISIHANSIAKKRAHKVHGLETFFLSPARSKRAKRVAAKENKGDMGSMNWSSKNSFLTILNQKKITESNKLAIDVQKNMLHTLRKTYGKKRIADGGVREAPFWVLVGAQMPSILIEVGYISHPVEGKRIYTRKYQKLIAKGIAKGINSYFKKN
ncbi:MAG: N-acetylmuramoyl-L-alanine amidase [Campylobacterota bacterium]|nr:N-acetylmuramoyl-L-alanine amidase [Campylobacterota bacterium]